MTFRKMDSTPLYGLVLAGGKSTRMGTDKGLKLWHTQPQRYHMADLLSKICTKTYISCRPDQVADMEASYECIVDSLADGGPLGAIAGALQQHPNKAWLIVACDLPLLDLATLQHLCNERNPEAIATSFISPYDQLPEPLIAIWEPQSGAVVQEWLEKGYKCPRKVLINSHCHLIHPPDTDCLLNANTPEEAARATTLIANKK